jgi:hypothetical protein
VIIGSAAHYTAFGIECTALSTPTVDRTLQGVCAYPDPWTADVLDGEGV